MAKLVTLEEVKELTEAGSITYKEYKGGGDPDNWAYEFPIMFVNEQRFYNQYDSIISNLAKKLKKGVYNKELAAKLWLYLVDNVAKYLFEFYKDDLEYEGYFVRKWSDFFPKSDRIEIAKYVEDSQFPDVEEAAEE